MSYGVEMWCADKLVSGRYSRGVLTVALALYRRLITPRGTLRGGDDEAAYGLDITALVGAVGYETAIGTLPGRIQGELEKDERVASVSVSVTPEYDAGGVVSLTIEIDVRLKAEDQEFQLSVSVNDLNTDLIRIEEAT